MKKLQEFQVNMKKWGSFLQVSPTYYKGSMVIAKKLLEKYLFGSKVNAVFVPKKKIILLSP